MEAGFGMFIGPLDGMRDRIAQSAAAQANTQATANRTEIRELTEQVERLSLLNQALWELLSEKTGLTDADLERRARDIDLRDGKADGKMTRTAVRCPSCSRVNSSRHGQCMYCGTLFEKMLFE
ncbi:MAG: hypothetical protein GC168_06880 [Candidatus Hydrogenedens sp.]|nr:hypothetical protein [Candidatus Hydrogenedens sp.]